MKSYNYPVLIYYINNIFMSSHKIGGSKIYLTIGRKMGKSAYTIDTRSSTF